MGLWERVNGILGKRKISCHRCEFTRTAQRKFILTESCNTRSTLLTSSKTRSWIPADITGMSARATHRERQEVFGLRSIATAKDFEKPPRNNGQFMTKSDDQAIAARQAITHAENYNFVFRNMTWNCGLFKLANGKKKFATWTTTKSPLVFALKFCSFFIRILHTFAGVITFLSLVNFYYYLFCVSLLVLLLLHNFYQLFYLLVISSK